MTDSLAENPHNLHSFPQFDTDVVENFGKSTIFAVNGKTITIGGVAESVPVEKVDQVIANSFRLVGAASRKLVVKSTAKHKITGN